MNGNESTCPQCGYYLQDDILQLYEDDITYLFIVCSSCGLELEIKCVRTVKFLVSPIGHTNE